MMDVGSIITLVAVLLTLWGFSLFIAYEAGKAKGSTWGSLRRSEGLVAEDLFEDDEK